MDLKSCESFLHAFSTVELEQVICIEQEDKIVA